MDFCLDVLITEIHLIRNLAFGSYQERRTHFEYLLFTDVENMAHGVSA